MKDSIKDVHWTSAQVAETSTPRNHSQQSFSSINNNNNNNNRKSKVQPQKLIKWFDITRKNKIRQIDPNSTFFLLFTLDVFKTATA